MEEQQHGAQDGGAPSAAGMPFGASRFYTPRDVVREPLHVYIPLINSQRWKTRYKHVERALKEWHDEGAVLHLVEVAFGHREWAFAESGLHGMPSNCPVLRNGRGTHSFGRTDPDLCHEFIGLRTWDELWHKEAALNVGFSRAPRSAYYFAWIDADITFFRTNWTGEVISQLQHYKWLQLFSHAQDLGPDSEVVPDSRHRDSFMWAHQQGKPLPQRGYYSGGRGPGLSVWSGLAWAAVRPALNETQGLIDFAIHGGGDWHMAWALLGRARSGLRKDLHPSYVRRVLAWEKHANMNTGSSYDRKNVGVLKGTIAHRHHGPKADRRYAERHKMLADLRFDPDADLRRDLQGLYQLVDHGDERSTRLRDVLRWHARLRNEDDPNT